MTSIPNKAKTQPSLPFDQDLYANRLERAVRFAEKSDHTHLFLHKLATKALQDRLAVIKKSFDRPLQWGGFYPVIDKLHNWAGQAIPPQDDSSPFSIKSNPDHLPFAKGSFDLVLSPLSFHAVNDLPGLLIQLRHTLKADGCLLAVMFGGETLRELRQILSQTDISCFGGVTPRIMPFADKRQMGGLMQRAGYALPVVDEDRITVTYPNLIKLCHDLRYMGESNILNDRVKSFPGKSYFEIAENLYREQFSDKDGRLEATFDLIYMIGWAPDPSQQQPLRPGSASERLANALMVEEISTGVIPGED